MGARLSRRSPQTSDVDQGAPFIDAQGNIQQPPRNPRPGRGGRPFELPEARGARFASIGDAPPSTDRGRQGFQSFPIPRLKSAVGFFAVLQVVIYCAATWLVTPRGVYEPTQEANWKIGSSNSFMERCAIYPSGKYLVELRRFITAIFLHQTPFHILGNLSMQLVLGPRMLATYGRELFVALFLATGVCGTMLGDAFEINGVGASTSGYGLVGAMASQIWLSWGSMEVEWRRWLRNILILVCVIAVIWEVATWKITNHWAHCGGLLSGIAIGTIFTREPLLPIIPGIVPALPPDLQLRRRICAVLLALLVIGCVVKIFFWGPMTEVEIDGTMFSRTKVCAARWDDGYAK